MRTILSLLALGLIVVAAGAARADAPTEEPLWLVTEGEAMLAGPPTSRGTAELPKSGPVIKIDRPALAAELSPPFPVEVTFEPRPGGAAVKMESLKVTYLKVIEVDVTDRFRPYIKDNRLIVEKANVPQGRHRLKILITDQNGNQTAEILTVTVK